MVPRRIFECLLVLLSFVAIPTHCPRAATSGGPDLGDLISGTRPIDPYSRTGRLELAGEIREELLAIQNSIPSLSPREEAWRVSELDRIAKLEWMDAAKQRVLLSQKPEFARWQTKEFVTSQLQCIDMIEHSAEFEMAGWAGLAASLLETERYQQMADLARAGQVTLPNGHLTSQIADVDAYVGYVPRLLSQGILQRILMPNYIPAQAREEFRKSQASR